MTENNDTDFFGDSDIKLLVEELWAKVFEASNKLIKDTKVFGFSDIGVIPNPNIHQMLAALSVMDGMLDTVLFHNQNGTINIGDTRMIINAKQQILNMETIATALKTNDRESYEKAIKRLHKQAQI